MEEDTLKARENIQKITKVECGMDPIGHLMQLLIGGKNPFDSIPDK